MLATSSRFMLTYKAMGRTNGKKANEIDLTLFADQPVLSRRWSEFVNCPRRLKSEAPFLLSLLANNSCRVLDAAMGIGCETVFFAKHGCDVTGNEIDPNLAAQALKTAAMEKVSIRLTNFDWLKLAQEFQDETFDLVLVMGNSFCLLRDKLARAEAARNLRAICKPGGSLVIDERNFSYILENKDDILRGHFRYSNQVMYCGSSILGHPVHIENTLVRFVYEDAKDKSILGYLDMYPFQKDELKSLFYEAGFESVKVYSDFKIGDCSTADFFTYVFC